MLRRKIYNFLTLSDITRHDDLRVFCYLQCLKLTCHEATKHKIKWNYLFFWMFTKLSSWWWTELMVEMIKSKDRSTTVTVKCEDKSLGWYIDTRHILQYRIRPWWHQFMDSASVRMQIFTRISCKPSDDISRAHLVPSPVEVWSWAWTLKTEHRISVGISGDGIWVSWCRVHSVQPHWPRCVLCSLTRPMGV